MRSDVVGPGDLVELVRFSLLGHQGGVPASQVAPVRSTAGLCDAVPVETFVGMAAAQVPPASQRVLLSVRAGNQDPGVVVAVEATADLVRMPITAIHPLPVLVGLRHQLKGLHALAWDQDYRSDPLVLLFDWS